MSGQRCAFRAIDTDGFDAYALAEMNAVTPADGVFTYEVEDEETLEPLKKLKPPTPITRNAQRPTLEEIG